MILNLRSTLLCGVALLVTAGGLAGCASDDDAGDGSGAGATRPTITIVTYSSYVLDPEVQKAVERDLGVRLKVSASGDGAEALSAAVLTAGRPEGDVFFGVDNTLMKTAVAGKVFERPAASSVPALDAIPADLRLDESGTMVPIDVGPVCVDYDSTWFEEHSLAPPTSLQDLTGERYRDLLVVESPITSSTGSVFLAATHEALGDRAPEFWQQLVDNGVSVAGSWDDAWNTQYTVNGGDRPLVVSYASSPPAEVFYSEGKLTTPRTGVVTATCADQIEFGAVLRGTDHPKEAAAVLNAMMERPWQESLPLANFVYPALPDAELPDLFTRFAPRPADSIQLDPARIDASREEWLDEWRSIVE